MKERLEKSIKLWLGILISIVAYYTVHEGMHVVVAKLLGVFEKIRVVGVVGMQVVTTEGSLYGINLALFSILSSVVTILIGYVLAFNPNVYKIKNKSILIGVYYITLCFLLLDPLYMSVLNLFIGGGGDLNGVVTGLGVSAIPFRIIFGVILAVNIFIFRKKVYPKYKEIFKN